MTTNGKELFLDWTTRVRKIQQIIQFLASIENKDPQNLHLHVLAHKFEDQVFSAAMNIEDYNNRIHEKLAKVQKERQQQAAAVQAKQGTQSLEQARLHQQQHQQQALQQRRWAPHQWQPHQWQPHQWQPHQWQPHQQVTGGSLLQQQGLPIQTPTATSGASTPGAAAAAAAVTAAWPNQPYTSPYSTIYSVPGTSSVGGRRSKGPGGAYEWQTGNVLVSNASRMGRGVDAAAQAAANVVASAAMGIPRQAAPVGPGSRGIGRHVSSVMVMQTGHGSGSAQSQIDAEDREKQHRSLRAEELRSIYQEDAHYFVQNGSSLLNKLYKTRPAYQNLEPVLKVVRYVKEGHNALLYINRCLDTGHVPSDASLHSLEHTLIRVHKASNALQVVIRDHLRTQQNNISYGPGGGGGGAGGSGGGGAASSAAATALTSAASIPTEAAAVQAKQGTQSLEQAGLHEQQLRQQVAGSSLLQQQGLPIQTSTAISGANIPGATAAATATAVTAVSHVRQRQAAAVRAKQGTQSLEQAGLHEQQLRQQVAGSSLLQQQGLPIQTSTAISGANIPGATAAATAAAVTAAWPNQPYTPPESAINSVPGISSVDVRGSRGTGGAHRGEAGNALVSNASQMEQGVDVIAQVAANLVAFASMNTGHNVSSATVLKTEHGSGSAQSQVYAEDLVKREHRC